MNNKNGRMDKDFYSYFICIFYGGILRYLFNFRLNHEITHLLRISCKVRVFCDGRNIFKVQTQNGCYHF